MNVERYEYMLKNLKFGEVPHVEEDSCEICGVYLGKGITSSNPLNCVNGMRLCWKHASEEYKKINNKI